MPAPIPASPPAGIALFDLDGTLLPWDCQLLFRHHVVRREPWRAIFLPIFLAALPLAPVLGTAGMKRVFLSYLLGMDAATLARHSREFAATLTPILYPELLQQLEKHRQDAHLLILSSASPEFYVAEIGRNLGFHITLGTPVETGASSPLFPDLENHKGHAKVRRLREVLPPSCFLGATLRNCHGYTDSTADLPMLALCQRVTLVNPSPILAQTPHTEILRAARPWKSRAGFLTRVLALLTGLGHDPAGLSARKIP